MTRVNLSAATSLIFSFIFFPFLYWEGSINLKIIFSLISLSISGYLAFSTVFETLKLPEKTAWGYSLVSTYLITAYFARAGDSFYTMALPFFICMVSVILIAYSSSQKLSLHEIPSNLSLALAGILFILPLGLLPPGKFSGPSLLGAFATGTIWIATNHGCKSLKKALLYSLILISSNLLGYYLGKNGNKLEIALGVLILIIPLSAFFRSPRS